MAAQLITYRQEKTVKLRDNNVHGLKRSDNNTVKLLIALGLVLQDLMSTVVKDGLKSTADQCLENQTIKGRK